MRRRGRSTDRALLDVTPLPGWRAVYLDDDGTPCASDDLLCLGTYADTLYDGRTLEDIPDQPPLTERPRGASYYEFDSRGSGDWCDTGRKLLDGASARSACAPG